MHDDCALCAIIKLIQAADITDSNAIENYFRYFICLKQIRRSLNIYC